MAKAPTDENGLNEKQARFAEEYLIEQDARRAANLADLALTTSDCPATFYVYGLVDPKSAELFYVGKGKGRRWMQHYLRSSGGCNSRKDSRIAAAGDRLCVVFGSGMGEQQALDVELALIRALEAHLTNMNHHRSAWRRQKDECSDALTRVIPFGDWLARAPRTDDDIAVYRAVVAGLQRIAEHGPVDSVTFRSVNGGPWSRVAT